MVTGALLIECDDAVSTSAPNQATPQTHALRPGDKCVGLYRYAVPATTAPATRCQRARRGATAGRTRDAVERCLERICEAAHRLGKHAEEPMPGQPMR